MLSDCNQSKFGVDGSFSKATRFLFENGPNNNKDTFGPRIGDFRPSTCLFPGATHIEDLGES